jgi:adenylate cyclase
VGEASGPLRRERRERYVARLGRLLRETDRNEKVLSLVHAARRAAPGSDGVADALSVGGRTSDRLARLISQAGDQPSATRELGLGAVQVCQALSRSWRLRQPGAEITIVFTDLIDFSAWALQAGDDHVSRLLAEVGKVSDAAITRLGGNVVKSLGDCLMAVFPDAESAIETAYQACTAVSAITLDGYRPQLRAGLHTRRPRRIGDDYLGVDVNVAARVAAAASAGEVLASGPALANVATERYVLPRRRRFRAKAAPKDLDVYSVLPRFGRAGAAQQ